MAVTISEVLEHYSFYREASKTLQNEIMNNAGITKLEPNTFFYEKDGQCSHIVLIGTGSVRVFVVGETGGREVTLYHVRPGESCPVNILSALLDMGAPAVAIVEEPLEAVVLPASIFRKWVEDHPVIQKFVFQALASRLVDLLSVVEVNTFQRMDQRLAQFLLGQFQSSDSNPPIARVTHEKIAVELGSVREVISRLLGDFEHMGVVGLARGRVVQKDKVALDKMARD